MLAPWMEPARLERIFGHNLLDDAAQEEGFRELVGLGEHKPFECVGEEAESHAALELLRERDGWRDARVVRSIHSAPFELDPLLEPSTDHCVPARFEGAARALL